MSLETFIVDLIEKRRRVPLALFFLRGISLLFKGGVFIRNFLFDRGFLKVERVSLPVVSIGNIVAGGVGKTPLVKRLARDLEGSTVLLRGYRSSWEKGAHLVTESTRVEECGDEARLLYQSGATVSVGRDRVLLAKKSVGEGVKRVILDDGMQFRYLHRDWEIVVMDGRDLFGKGYFLPRGYLRDSPRSLKRADYIVVNRVRDESEYRAIAKELSFYTRAPIIGMEFLMEGVENWKGKKVGVFSGIGNPNRFIEGLEEEGIEVVSTLFVDDHRPFCVEKLALFARACQNKGALALLCTEKDSVKVDTTFSLPVEVIRGELSVCFGEVFWKEMIKKIGNDE